MANIKAGEIRIGNWYDQFGNYHQVSAETIKTLSEAPENQIWCKPIPLTEEWLVEFGATTYEFDNGQPNQYRIGEDFYVIRDGVITDYGTSVKLPFVHTLQNLYFAKRGKELTLQTNKQ